MLCRYQAAELGEPTHAQGNSCSSLVLAAARQGQEQQVNGASQQRVAAAVQAAAMGGKAGVVEVEVEVAKMVKSQRTLKIAGSSIRHCLPDTRRLALVASRGCLTISARSCLRFRVP
mmetsp:Transcript_207/g.694  ORF Transcript_207/g.694 Transcript_207/m.694 type:complete len:117 (+) Transcript_207:200-550(+)